MCKGCTFLAILMWCNHNMGAGHHGPIILASHKSSWFLCTKRAIIVFYNALLAYACARALGAYLEFATINVAAAQALFGSTRRCSCHPCYPCHQICLGLQTFYNSVRKYHSPHAQDQRQAATTILLAVIIAIFFFIFLFSNFMLPSWGCSSCMSAYGTFQWLQQKKV